MDKGFTFALPARKRKGDCKSSEIYWKALEKIKRFIFKNACEIKKKLYFCTRFENESSEGAEKNKKTRS